MREIVVLCMIRWKICVKNIRHIFFRDNDECLIMIEYLMKI
ncbi:hypothetical protein BN191_360002 [Clostridioides difficile T61]|nr:hypothetical protein BN191_360002 [Clostridioides difficile T61]